MLTLYDFLRAEHVKRWHVVNTTKQQSIAEHSYLVAIIALHLCKEFGGTMQEQHETAVWALFHDAVEIRTGDIPTPAKRLLREVNMENDGVEDIFDKLDRRLMVQVPHLPLGEPSDLPAQCVKIADAIEAAHWIRENGVGRHAELVAVGCWRRVEDIVAGYDCYDQANQVLQALGLPYVSREERASPP